MIKIAFSRATSDEKYQLYINWLKSIDADFDYLNFYGLDPVSVQPLLETCSGLVLTGGPDVHPSFYGRAEEESRCVCDFYRDELEFLLIKKALDMRMPVLAICRGEQILNVSQGGDLIVDLPEDFGSDIVHRLDSAQLASHEVRLDFESQLFRMSGLRVAEVVSVHHQAVNILADCFRPVAFSVDGLIEAFEWLDPAGKSYLNAVQWHPEKGNFQNEMSRAIGVDFMRAAHLFNHTLK